MDGQPKKDGVATTLGIAEGAVFESDLAKPITATAQHMWTLNRCDLNFYLLLSSFLGRPSHICDTHLACFLSHRIETRIG